MAWKRTRIQEQRKNMERSKGPGTTGKNLLIPYAPPRSPVQDEADLRKISHLINRNQK